MSLICSVCHDTLFLSEDGVKSRKKVSSAKCGHLFHTDCIDDVQAWAGKKESRSKYINCCPSCQVNVGDGGFILLRPKFAKAGGKQPQEKAPGSKTPDDIDNSIRQLTISRETFDNLKKLQDAKAALQDEKLERERVDELRQEEDRRRAKAQMLAESKQKRWQDEQARLERDFEFENSKAKNRQDQLTRSYEQHKTTFENLSRSRNSDIERGYADYKRRAEDATKQLEDKKRTFEQQQRTAGRIQEWERAVKDYKSKMESLERDRSNLVAKQKQISAELEQSRSSLERERLAMQRELGQANKDLERKRQLMFDHLKTGP